MNPQLVGSGGLLRTLTAFTTSFLNMSTNYEKWSYYIDWDTTIFHRMY